jgi:hypothetical protein
MYISDLQHLVKKPIFQCKTLFIIQWSLNKYGEKSFSQQFAHLLLIPFALVQLTLSKEYIREFLQKIPNGAIEVLPGARQS